MVSRFTGEDLITDAYESVTVFLEAVKSNLSLEL